MTFTSDDNSPFTPGARAPLYGSAVVLQGESAAIRRVRAEIRACARSDQAIVLLGESGSGEEAIARAIHAASARASSSFMISSVDEDRGLDDDSLFWSSSPLSREGTLLIAHADGLGVGRRTKLATAVQQRRLPAGWGVPEYDALGIPVDDGLTTVRARGIVSLDWDSSIDEFRTVALIKVPALRERREDILPIAEACLAKVELPAGSVRSLGFDDVARAALVHHPFPGNVASLIAMIERAARICATPPIGIKDLPILPAPTRGI